MLKKESEMEKMRANLLRAVSHDFRTPLTTIYGASSALIESGSEFTDEQKEKMLRGIQQDSQWLYRMVENLLSVTRLDGDINLIKTPIYFTYAIYYSSKKRTKGARVLFRDISKE